MRFAFATFYVACCLPLCALGQSATPVPTDQEQIQTWIEMLDSPRYRDRATATANLQNLGLAAVPTLEEIASSGGSEASDRALEILKRHFQSSDGVLKAKAGEALKRISEQTETPKAKAADKILNPEEEEEVQPFGPMIRPPQMGVPVNRRVNIRVTINNGAKDVTVEENGESIRVQENQQDGIRVERKDANGNITKKTYKDADELKEQDPKAHRVYEKASPNRAGGFRFEMKQGFPGIPAPQIAPNGQPNFDEIRKRHEALHQQHLKMIEELRKQHQGAPQPIQPDPAPADPPTPKPADVIEV